MIAITVFYVISIVFYGIWSCAVSLSCRINKNFNECDRDKHHRFVEVLQAPSDFTFRHDFIKLNAPMAGNRITKLKAEIHMSGSLAAAFGLCFCISLTGFIDQTLSGIELVARASLFLLASVGLIYANRHFSARLYRSVGSYSELLGFNEDDYTLPESFKEGSKSKRGR